jgi:hypothetical protein
MKSLILCVVLPVLPLGGCFTSSGGGGGGISPQCEKQTTVTIDTGASLTYTVGVDAGYYFTYGAGGAWHAEWTCDTDLSDLGCNFTGTINVDTPAGGAGVTCFNCEPEDQLTTAVSGSQTVINFDTITSTGIDGVDFNGVPGDPITIDIQINGIYQNDLVFIPSLSRAASAPCMPLDLDPSTP